MSSHQRSSRPFIISVASAGSPAVAPYLSYSEGKTCWGYFLSLHPGHSIPLSRELLFISYSSAEGLSCWRGLQSLPFTSWTHPDKLWTTPVSHQYICQCRWVWFGVGLGLMLISGAVGIALQWIWESIPAVGGWIHPGQMEANGYWRWENWMSFGSPSTQTILWFQETLKKRVLRTVLSSENLLNLQEGKTATVNYL